MHRNRIAVLAAGVAMLLGTASPALAAGSGTTVITFTVSAGTLDITVPAGPVSIGTVTPSTSAQTIGPTPLGNVEVLDNRGGTAGWTATVSGTNFVGPSTVPIGAASYTTPTATVTGTATVANTSVNPLTNAPSNVQVATAVSGINTATWNPTITIVIPANTLAGTYTSTLTHSVA